MTYKTRSERHQKIQKKSPLDKKTVLPMLGTALMVAPATLVLAPQQVQADEYQAPENNAYNLIDQIGWTAQEVAASNDLYASVMIAQALLESGNGSSLLATSPYYNLFGVKAYGGEPSVWLPTQEYLNGQWVTMNEPFRAYGSYWESLQDHAAVLKSMSYSTGVAHYKGAWKSQTTSYADATAYLTGRYATDPAYNQKLNWLIANYDLTRFDTPGQATDYSYTEMSTASASATTETASASTNSGGSYVVVAGDTLWDIANANGISVDQLMANNGLTSELIVVGQQLII
ncbi:glucosaminidase domain-containing protein [Enterococcus saccharolyticus]|uniref:Peptidoglycan hydrolase n=1 Tax=Candidatus Enterococcus willemsii TaxID=1857215 RepID=A0ABQ6YVV3_9ENTE|nr:N-acetylmuramoyl-L-alanine amidase [Enterococcus sp. CU12B]